MLLFASHPLDPEPREPNRSPHAPAKLEQSDHTDAKAGQKCLELDMHLRSHEESVHNYPYLRDSEKHVPMQLPICVSVTMQTGCILPLAQLLLTALLRPLAQGDRVSHQGLTRPVEAGREVLLEGAIPDRRKGVFPGTGIGLRRPNTAAQEGRVGPRMVASCVSCGAQPRHEEQIHVSDYNGTHGRCTPEKCPYKHEKPTAPSCPCACQRGWLRWENRQPCPHPCGLMSGPSWYPEAAPLSDQKSSSKALHNQSSFAYSAACTTGSTCILAPPKYGAFRVASAPTTHVRLLAMGIRAIRGLLRSGA